MRLCAFLAPLGLLLMCALLRAEDAHTVGGWAHDLEDDRVEVRLAAAQELSSVH